MKDSWCKQNRRAVQGEDTGKSARKPPHELIELRWDLLKLQNEDRDTPHFLPDPRNASESLGDSTSEYLSLLL